MSILWREVLAGSIMISLNIFLVLDDICLSLVQVKLLQRSCSLAQGLTRLLNTLVAANNLLGILLDLISI